MSSAGQHVVPNGSGWSVRKTGSPKAFKIFPTQEAAIESARHLAKKQKSKLYIHGRDGRIREWDFYEADAA